MAVVTQLNLRKAKDEDKCRIIRTIRHCRRHHQLLAGYPYGDEITGPNGILLELIVPEGTSSDMCRQALKMGYQERDVERHSVLVCPVQWFMEADGQVFDRDMVHDYVVAHGYGEPSDAGYELAERWFWLGKDYATIAAEIVTRDLCIDHDSENEELGHG